MCGFSGYLDLRNAQRIDEGILSKMTAILLHRGPDSSGFFRDGNVGLGFRRLSIVDLTAGDQPLYNEDRSIVLVCNGEIYNYRELKNSLLQKGHVFQTETDVEVLPHLYEEEGINFLNKINGQFALVIYDRKERRLWLARDHFGINPLYYTVIDGLFIFASEIKSILEHPTVSRTIDLTGLDQMFSLPGLVSPRTMFANIKSLKGGHYLLVHDSNVSLIEYWDLDYPLNGECPETKPEAYYIDLLRNLLRQSVKYRLQSDVPVGFYLSGGLDSSLIAALIAKESPNQPRHSFSITFPDSSIDESPYQKLMVEYIHPIHHEINFDWLEISRSLKRMIYHSECPVKETYNTCSLALSALAKQHGVSVVLSGEGADELFAGYVGYGFDQFRTQRARGYDLETILESELRQKLWGDENLFYEKDFYAFGEIKASLYSSEVRRRWPDFNFLNFELVNKARLQGRHFIHQRSYLDFKLRLSDHLVSDHGDRMALANSVEARYPFLDIDLIEFSRRIPPELKLNQHTEKYILRKMSESLLPQGIINREKFAFHAPGSPYLLQQDIEWINDLLSYARIKREGYFDPDVVEQLKMKYSQVGFKLNLPFEDDYLITILTFNIFLDVFNIPAL